MNIFVGNLLFAATGEDLKTLFAGFGSVASALIVMEKEKKAPKSRGFGFVEMPDEQQALAAICRTPKRTMEIDKQWRFTTDAQDEGLMSGWMQPDFAEQGWPLLDADLWWQEQGYPDYHGCGLC